MSIKTIELSTYNSVDVLSNSEYTCTFPPVQINNGTQIQISQAFFDSTINANYQNIAITQDTLISLEFGIYYTNLNDGNITYSKAPSGLLPLGLYVCRNPISKLLYTDTAQVLIKQGNYTPPELANIITKTLSKVPNLPSIRDTAFVPGSLLKESNLSYSFPCQAIPTGEGELVSTLFASIIPVSPYMYAHFAVGNNINIQWDNENSERPYSGTITTTLRSFNQITGELTFDTNANFYKTQAPTKSVSVLTVNQITATFYNQTDPTDFFSFDNAHERYIGTSQFGFEFDDEAGKFQFTQIHMPMYDLPAGGQAVQGVSVKETVAGSGTYGAADTRSGIFFTDLQPKSFWNNLGFELDNMLVVDGSNSILRTRLVRGVNITSHLFGYDGIISHTYVLPSPLPPAAFFYATETVINIEADNELLNNDSGYFLIELAGLKTEFLNDHGQQFGAIMNISSKNYNQGGYITAYGDGSITYINNGEPYLLSSLRVRILDPITKTPITTLGDKNSVFIQVIS